MAGYTPTVLQRGLSSEHRPRGHRQRGRAATAAGPAAPPIPKGVWQQDPH
jgi:hypothetical protein